jgi:SAM-dependent methyltransferase
MTATNTINPEAEVIREKVRDKYGELAKAAGVSSCCQPAPAGSSSCCQPKSADPITGNLYTDSERGQVPQAAMAASLGCGNPTALASLEPGETVLDLGSGGGIDVILSAKRVGPAGFAYGLDMTDEMLALANKNKRDAGIENVSFLKGHIEEIPLPDNSVDVIISNCVINLSADKPKVIQEAFRVLKPGGRFAVSDIVAFGELPEALRKDMEAWVGCVSGALDADTYTSYLTAAGFGDVGIQVTREYDPKDLAETMEGGCCSDPNPDWDASAYAAYYESGGKLTSAFVRAVKPAA